MKKLSQALLPILLGNCLVASVAFSQTEGVTFNGIEARPDTYTVRKGDTLYDLSGTYLGDVLLWPQLWSYNPQVTNPHWIYPGDLLYLRPHVAGAKAPAATPTAPPKKRVNRWVLKREFIPLVAILSEEDEEVHSIGEIVASPRDAEMLKQYDSIWIKKNPNAEKEPKVGEYYVVYHETTDLIPTTAYGDRRPYTVMGVIQITELPKQDQSPYYKGKIVYSDKEIVRGDLLLPYSRQNLDVKIKPATTDLVGKIIYSVTPRTQLAARNYIFIDRGSEQGVQVGNRFFVYQPGDLYLVDQNKELEDVPMMRVGQLLVLSVDKNTSLAVVTDSKKEFEVGDRIEMYKGY